MLWFAQGSASLFSPVAELRAQERAEELGQWKTHSLERRVIDASTPAASRLALMLTDGELDSLEKRAGDGEIEGRTTRWIRCRKPSTGCAPW
jgi:hypothetical protein